MIDEIFSDKDVHSFGSIQYKIIRNGAASKNKGRDVYSALVIPRETYGTLQIADRMANEGCTVKASSIRMVLDELVTLITQLVSEGRAVNIGGLIRFMPSIRGNFDSPDEPLDPKKHEILINACSGKRMRARAAKSPTSRLDGPPIPVVMQVVNKSNAKSNRVSSNGDFLVVGKHLTWNESAADEGWFIVCDGRETKCVPTVKEQEPTCAVMNTGVTFAASGMEVSLVFRTRLGGKTLHRVEYDTQILTL